MTRWLLGVLVLLAATPAQANHIAGHYGGVPMVQPAPLPWRNQPPPQWRGPAPSAPVPLPPPPPAYIPIPVQPAAPQVDESPSIPARRRAPNVCDGGC